MRAAVLANSVAKDYGGRRVLTVREFAVMEGELIAVVGPSGAGKSTLLRLLAGVERPDVGEVRRQLATGSAAFVPQRPAPFRMGVTRGMLRSLAWHGVRGSEAGRRAHEALAAVGLAEMGGRYAPSLSGGEIQRLGVARALALRPALLLLDEPTASLDPGGVERVERALAGFRRERRGGQHGEVSPDWALSTVVLVTHSLFQARRLADRVAFLWNGELIEVAPVERFFTEPADARTKAFVEGGLVY